MLITRRDFVKQAAVASAAVPAIAQAQSGVQTKESVNPLPVRVGMTDWNLGQRGDISKIALAREIGLDGIQVSVQYPTDGSPTVRDRKTQEAFRRAALENGIQICSLAIGNPGKSRMPMHTNAAFGILLAEAVEIAHNLGTNNILLPILGDSHIDMKSQAQIDSFVAMMKEVARYGNGTASSSAWKTGSRRKTTSGCWTRSTRTTWPSTTTRTTSSPGSRTSMPSRRCWASGSTRST
jgi:hypothetical protein